jgi:hypothetical protein
MTKTLGPADPIIAAAVATIETMYADGEPTEPRAVIARFRSAGIDLADDVITEACRWVPYRPITRRPRIVSRREPGRDAA